MSKVAYIIVGWNNRDLLEQSFKSLYDQTFTDHPIIYVDNSSADDSVEYVKKTFPEVRIIEPGSNTGFAKGNNIGFAEALKDKEVEYMVMLNSDAILADDWTALMYDFASKKPKGALFQGTTYDFYNHAIIDSTHIYISRNGQGTQGSWRYFAKADMGPKKVFGVNAAACMISRRFIETQPFNQVFDEALFMYLEDIDLACRATVMGWDNYLVRGVKAYHMGSASSGKNPGFSLYMTFRNNGAVLFKNLPLGMLLKMMPKIIKGDLDTIRTLRNTNRSSAVKSVIKGRCVGMLRIPLFTFKRLRVRKISKIDHDYLWQLMDRGY